MADLIKFLRGIKSKLTRDLNLGEPCYITDEERLYIGGSNGNVSLPNNKDIENVNLESTGYGVIGNGLEVTAQSTPNMTVAVSSSPVHMPNGKRFTPPSNTALSIMAADSNKPRKDIVYVNSSGVISCLSSNLGTAAVKGSRSYTLSTNAAGAISGSNTYTLDKNFVAGDAVVFDGVTFTATSSTQNATNFVVGTDIATSMANLATALNANTTVNAIYTVNASNGIITITEKIAGGGNTPSTMTVTGTGVITVGTAISSKPNDTVTINSIIFTAVLSGANDNQFNIGADTTETAANLVNALNANSNINALYTATSSLNVIILTEKVAGGGNTPTSSSTTGTITITNVLVATSTAQIYPPAPSTPDEGFLLAEIAIGAGATNIVQSNITDKRIFKLNNNQLGSQMAESPKLGYEHTTLDTWLKRFTGQFLDVRDFGATADGTDDTQAFLDAINACPTGGLLFVPRGTYRITQRITISKNMSIVGTNTQDDTQNAILLTGSVLDFNGVEFTGSAIKIQANGVRIENLTINNSSNTSTNIQTGIQILPFIGNVVWNITLRNILVRGFGTHNIYANGLLLSSFEHVFSSNSTNAFYFDNSVENGTSVILKDCWAYNCTGTGYYFDKYYYSTLIACACDNCQIAYSITYCKAISIISCGSEYSKNENVYIYNSEGVTITGYNGAMSNKSLSSHGSSSFAYVDGSSKNITFIGCIDLLPATGTTYAIVSPVNITIINCNFTLPININSTSYTVASNTVLAKVISLP